MLDKTRQCTWHLRLMAVMLVAAVTSSCDSTEAKGRTGVVLSESGTPISGATVYEQRKQGDAINSSRHYQVTLSDDDGRYQFGPASGEFRHIAATADGYYPGLADAAGTVRLRTMPKDPLPVQEGVLRCLPGRSCGFSFSSGRQCAPAEADFVLEVGRNENFRIIGPDAGGIARIQLDMGEVAVNLRFVETIEAPQDGYVRSMRSDPVHYEAWWVRTRDGSRYAKILFEGLGEGPDGERSFDFQYVHQPDGGRVVAGKFTHDDLRSLLGVER